jgi:hypothetical protein
MDRPRTGRSSGNPPPSPTSVDSFALEGPANLPDPEFHAYRRDLADRSLAGRVIASHFVEPAEHTVVRAASFRAEPSEEAIVLHDLVPGDRFRLLESRFDWAWGYAGPDERVGYVRAEALGIE